MAYRVQHVTPTGSLAFQVQAPDTGRPMRITTYTGEAVIAGEVGAVMVFTRNSDNAGPVGFFVPDVPPLTADETPPRVIAEVYLCGVVVHGVPGHDTNYGVADVSAAYAPDPRGGPTRWLTLNFTCRAVRGIRIGYRVTVTGVVGQAS